VNGATELLVAGKEGSSDKRHREMHTSITTRYLVLQKAGFSPLASCARQEPHVFVCVSE